MLGSHIFCWQRIKSEVATPQPAQAVAIEKAKASNICTVKHCQHFFSYLSLYFVHFSEVFFWQMFVQHKIVYIALVSTR